jgi:hypothetical protein
MLKPCTVTFRKPYCKSVCFIPIVYISFLLKEIPVVTFPEKFVNDAGQGTNKYFPLT